MSAGRKGAPMYKTILMPLDGTPTDRAIIEHIKQLAAILHSRVVLFHVADERRRPMARPGGGRRRGRRKPGLSGQGQGRVRSRRHPGRSGTRLRRPGAGNRQMGSGERLRPGGDGHAWAPRGGRPVSGKHGQPGPTQRQRAGAPAQGANETSRRSHRDQSHSEALVER